MHSKRMGFFAEKEGRFGKEGIGVELEILKGVMVKLVNVFEERWRRRRKRERKLKLRMSNLSRFI